MSVLNNKLIGEYMKQIIVEVKNVYGNDLVYPVCQDAISFASISGKTTLTSDALRLVQTLGYEIVVQSAALPI